LGPATPDAIPVTIAKPMTAAELLALVRDKPAALPAGIAAPPPVDAWKAIKKEWGKVSDAAGTTAVGQWVGVVVGAGDLVQKLTDPKATTLDHTVASMELVAKLAKPLDVQMPLSVRFVFDLTRAVQTFRKPDADIIKGFFRGTNVVSTLAQLCGGVIPPQVGLILKVAEATYDCVGEALQEAARQAADSRSG
jgi:hypothetical protein